MDQGKSSHTLKNTSAEEGKDKRQSCYVDDMTYLMAWQNFCITNYSWYIYQMSIYQNACAMRLHTDMMNQQHQQTLQQQGPQLQQQQAQQQPRELSYSLHLVFKLASIQKRIVAEAIDFFLLAFAKALVILYLYGNEYVDHFEFLTVIDEKMKISDVEWMLVQALLYRLVVVAYEGYCLSGTLPFSTGQTIGKKIMGIKPLYCPKEQILEVNLEDRTVQTVHNPLGALRSCLRSVLKTMAVSLFFPLMVPFVTFKHNRLIYDLAVDTIVVEK